MENPNAPLTAAENATVATWLEMLDAWVMNPNVGLRFMYLLHRMVLATYTEHLGEHATLQSAGMAIRLEEAGQQSGDLNEPAYSEPAYPGESDTPLKECPCVVCRLERQSGEAGTSRAVDTSDAPQPARFART